MSIEKLCDLTDYEQYIFNITISGDENVIGFGKLEAKNEKSMILDPALVKKALYFMFKRHPLFRTIIKRHEQENRYYFEIYDETVRSEDMMKYEFKEMNGEYNGTSIMEEFEVFLSKPFDYEKMCLLWRFKLINFIQNNKNVYFYALVVPLFMTDGLNITVLVFELANIMNSLLDNKECEEMNDKLNLCSNMQELMIKRGFYNDHVKNEIEKMITNERLIHFNMPLIFKNNGDNNGTKMNIFKLNEVVTAAILKQSKERKIRLTGFLVTIALNAFKQLFDKQNIAIQRDFSVLLPANLRFRLGSPEIDLSDMRFFVVLVSINLFYPQFKLASSFEDLDIEEIWESAKYVNEIICEKTKFENGSLLQYSHNLKHIDEANRVFEEYNRKFTAAELNRHNFCDFLVSNLGSHASDRKTVIDGEYKLTEVYHGDCLSTVPSYFSAMMLHIITFNNQMMFQLSTNRHMFAADHADNFMSIFKNFLEKSSGV